MRLVEISWGSDFIDLGFVLSRRLGKGTRLELAGSLKRFEETYFL